MVYSVWKGWMPYSGNAMDATHLVVSTNDVILNHSCRDMEMGVSYVKSLHKIGTMKQSFSSYNTIDYIKLTISIIDDLGNLILIFS